MRSPRPLGVAAVLVAMLAATGGARAFSPPDTGSAFEPHPLSTPDYLIPAFDHPTGNVVVKAGDGVDLYSDYWLPQRKAGGPAPPARVPLIVSFTPYEVPGQVVSGTLNLLLQWIVPRGYGFVVSHVRGTGGSGGCWSLLPLDRAELAVSPCFHSGQESG